MSHPRIPTGGVPFRIPTALCRHPSGALTRDHPVHCLATFTIAWQLSPSNAWCSQGIQVWSYTPRSLPTRTVISRSLIAQSKMDFPSLSTAGIETYESAILFAVFYAILACLYIWKTACNPAYAFVVLVIFCICESSLCAADRRAWLRVK